MIRTFLLKNENTYLYIFIIIEKKGKKWYYTIGGKYEFI